MENKLSIVVPVYKVEKYLDSCVKSLVSQNYKNIEIILVDDGSPDNCPKICDEWKSKDKRIKVIHKKNGGLSDARNIGLKFATGKYITFVDSDDYVCENAYEYAIENLKSENAQIFIFGRVYLYGNEKKIYQKQNVKFIMTSEEALDKMNLFEYYDVAAWDKVYERRLFEGIEYPVGKLSEDWYTTYKVIDKASKIVYDSIPLYIYRQRANSITHSNNFKINKEPIMASKEVLEFIKEKYPDIKLNALTRYVYASIGVYNNMIVYSQKSTEEMANILEKNIKMNYKEIISNKEITSIRKIQLFLIVKMNWLYNFFIKIFKSYKEKKAS